MGNRFDTSSVYGVEGEQLNNLDAVMRQLCGLRTLTFLEQRDLAEKLRLFLSAVTSVSEPAEVPQARPHLATSRGQQASSSESLAARVRRAQQRCSKPNLRQEDRAATNGDAVRAVRRRVLVDAG